MAIHARPKPNRVPRPLLRAGLTVSAAGAALAAGGTAPAYATVVPTNGSDAAAAVHALTQAVKSTAAASTGPAKSVPVNPLAKTPVDPFSNGVSIPIADFKPLNTTTVTGSLSRSGALKDAPLVGAAVRALPGGEGQPAARTRPVRAQHP